MRILTTLRLLNKYTSLPTILIVLILSGCDMLTVSPVGFFLDHTAVVSVAGVEGRENAQTAASGIDIGPGASVFALKLNNSRNIPIKLSLDAPELIAGGGAISCVLTQNGAEAFVTITGAALNDELRLTLRIRGDGRDFDPYTCTVRCPLYTVTFDTQGFGSTVPDEGVTLFGAVTDPGDPSVGGDPPFLGWFKESACVNPWNFGSDTVTANTTLYAKWTPDTPIDALDVINALTDITAPVHGDAAPAGYSWAPSAGGYTGTFAWTSGLSGGTSGNYVGGTPAVATVTLTAATGYTFTGTTITPAAIQAVFTNGSPAAAIQGTPGATLVFTLTYTVSAIVIDTLGAVTDIAAPVHGEASKTAVISAGSGYTGSFSWSGLSSGASGDYVGGTSAVATVTLTADAGYTFTGTAIGEATLQITFSSGSPKAAIQGTPGATLVFTLTYTVPPTVINNLGSIITSGITPIHDAASAAATINAGTGYLAGGFAWTSGLSGGTSGNYVYGIPAVATVTLTAATGYTFTGTTIIVGDLEARFGGGSPTAAIQGTPGATLVFTLTYTVAQAGTPTGSVSITGTLTQGQALEAVTILGGTGDISYQWKRGGTAVSGATGASYPLTLADVGQTITVVVGRVGYTGTRESTPTGTIAATSYSIGDTGPAGGIIFYVDDGTYGGGTWKYLEAAPADAGNFVWSTTNTDISGATGITIGIGQANTAALLADTTVTPAAQACADYGNGTAYDDWFLPSKDELNAMYTNIRTTGGFDISGIFYWSSSQSAFDGAWEQRFSDGDQHDHVKSNAYRVRAVRAF